MTTRIGVCIAAVLLLAQCAGAQTPRTGRLMREKLMHSQRILEALTTSDYTLLQKETRALTRVTENPEWTGLMVGALRPYTGDFIRALEELSGAADRRDLDAAGKSYGVLTAACVSCHKHVMKSRIARD